MVLKSSVKLYTPGEKRTRRDGRSNSRPDHLAKASSAGAFYVDDPKHRLGARDEVFVSRVRDALRRVHSRRERRTRQTRFELYFVSCVRRAKRRTGRAARGALQRDAPRSPVGAVRDTKQYSFRGRAFAEPDRVRGVFAEQNSHERGLQRLAPGNANHAETMRGVDGARVRHDHGTR